MSCIILIYFCVIFIEFTEKANIIILGKEKDIGLLCPHNSKFGLQTDHVYKQALFNYLFKRLWKILIHYLGGGMIIIWKSLFFSFIYLSLH